MNLSTDSERSRFGKVLDSTCLIPTTEIENGRTQPKREEAEEERRPATVYQNACYEHARSEQ